MSKWYNSLAGSASFAQLRPRTKWGLRNSILLMVLCTLTISMDLSGFFASNARKHITLTVFGQIKSNQLGGPFCAPLMSAGSGEKSKWVTPIKLIHTVQAGNFQAGNHSDSSGEAKGDEKEAPPSWEGW